MMEKSALSAVILTGSRDGQNVLLTSPGVDSTGIESKVMLPVGGKPMVASVFEAVAATRYKPKMYVSTNDPAIEALPLSVPFTVLPSGQTAVQSLLRGLEGVQDSEWVLFVSGDHPLLTTEMIEYFVTESMERKLSLGAAVVNRNLVNQHYPNSRRTYFPVKGGAYSGGNMYLIHKETFMGNVSVLETIDRNRKKPWKSAGMLDVWSMIQLLFRTLDIHEVAEKATGIIGCKSGVVEMPYPECCMDVDKLSDKEIAEEILTRRRQKESPPVAEDERQVHRSAV